MNKKKKNFIIIFGPAAVGKMSVGKALAAKTGLKLVHNHMSIELVLNFFDFGEKGFRKLDKAIRTAILQEIAESDYPGAIFTYVWALDEPSDEEYLQTFIEYFNKVGADTHFVELEASLETRLHRNVQPDRLAAKASKRDVERSKSALLSDEKRYRLNSNEGEFEGKSHIRINNNDLGPEEVAQKIIEAFNL
ncbi:MAG: AAA family ATPase [Bacteroidota bacterium]